MDQSMKFSQKILRIGDFKFVLLHFHENQSNVVGYQEWVKILMITLVSSQKSLPPIISASSVLQVIRPMIFFRNFMVFLRSRLTPSFGSSKVQVETAFSRRHSARHQAPVYVLLVGKRQQGTRELRREPLSESSKHVPTFFKLHLPDKPPRKRTNSPVQAFFGLFVRPFSGLE